MLTLNSLKIQVRILEYSAITSSTLHINSKLLIASFLQLILNFLRLYVLGVKHFDFNLQYLEVAARFFEDGIEDGIANGCGDAATNAISNPHSHS